MVVGRRKNVDVRHNETMQSPEDVTRSAKERGKMFLLEAEDYFFIAMNDFPWNLVPTDLVIARPGYDNFLVATAITNNISVVDATATLLAVHMTDSEGNLAGAHSSRRKDMNYDKRLIGRFNYYRGMTSSAQYATKAVKNDIDNSTYITLKRRLPMIRKPAIKTNVTKLPKMKKGKVAQTSKFNRDGENRTKENILHLVNIA